jgi:hypothetical protein
VEFHLIVADDQAVEEESIDALGGAVGGVAWIEVGRVGFNEEDDVAGGAWGSGAGVG